MAQSFRLPALRSPRSGAFADANVPDRSAPPSLSSRMRPLKDGPRTLRGVACFSSVALPLWVSPFFDRAPPTSFQRTAMRSTLNAVAGTATTELLKERVRALVASLDDSHEWARFVPGAGAVCEPHIRVCEYLVCLARRLSNLTPLHACAVTPGRPAVIEASLLVALRVGDVLLPALSIPEAKNHRDVAVSNDDGASLQPLSAIRPYSTRARPRAGSRTIWRWAEATPGPDHAAISTWTLDDRSLGRLIVEFVPASGASDSS